ncbi:MAG: hypothetical protein QOC63_1654 [Mycobacterium sp.]|jgi:hypothetical protein|nr:hypothetical protein [Mycobacterium sp.]
MFGDYDRATALRTWQVAGMSLAAGGVAVTRGPGAVAAVVALSPMVWAFGRLHRHAPTASSTSDLIGKVLGVRAGVFVGLLQLVGYLLLAVGFSRNIGLGGALLLVHDAESVTGSWWWPVCAVAAAIVAAALIYVCRVRLIVSIAAVLAAAGVLVYFYVGLSAIARVATGAAPHPTGGVAPETGLGTSTLLIVLGLTLLGFEAVTTLNARMSSVSRPIGAAMAVIALGAVTGWLAVALAYHTALVFDPKQMVLLASDLFADAGGIWLVASSVALGSAALLAITLAGVRVASRLTQQISQQSRVRTVTVGFAAMTAILAVITTRVWGDAGYAFSYVGPLALMALYVIAAEANSRLPGSSDAAMVLRFWMPAVGLFVVLVPLRYHEFDAASLWAISLSAAIGVVAALVAFTLPVDRNQTPQPT